MRYEFEAPWGTLLRVASIAATLLLAGVALLEAAVLPRELLGGWPWRAAVALPLALLAGAALFTVRGYVLEGGELQVVRLGWRTRLPLDGLTAAWADPEAMRKSLRLFGNGGLYSLTGLYRNARLGTYRAWATDPKRAVVVELARRKLVVTPDSPERFLEALRTLHPGVRLAESAP